MTRPWHVPAPPHSWAWVEVEVAQETNRSRSATSWRSEPGRRRGPGPGAALVAAMVEALQTVHVNRWVPAAVRPDFFIGVRQIGHSLALGERDLTDYTISPRCQQPAPITTLMRNHPEFPLLFQQEVGPRAPRSRR